MLVKWTANNGEEINDISIKMSFGFEHGGTRIEKAIRKWISFS